MGEAPPVEIPTLNDIYVAENNTELAIYCDKCGREVYLGGGDTLNVTDILVAAGSHVREHQEWTRVDERG